MSASSAMPPVKAPSPITAKTLLVSSLRSRASAIPSAAESEVLLWPASQTSCSLSARLTKPDKPSFWRSVWNRSIRPVSIL
ncbi:hypothetical protein GGC63_001962 [Paenibacillus sp. OAS669]|nr:hypothetical protein [Paenibacillus sp. OAS669]